MNKACTLCGVTKPLSAFFARKQMHDGRRSECKECSLARNSKWREANPEAFKASVAKHYATHKEVILARDKEYRERNKESVKARRRAQYAANPAAHRASVKRDAAKNPERIKASLQRFHANNPNYKAEYYAKYYKENRAKLIASALKRESYMKQQSLVVSGLTPAHKVEMDALYDFCQIFPGHEVDHIVPIQGKCVTGLHTPWNMQVLTTRENRRKSNKFDADSQSFVGTFSLQECISRSLLINILKEPYHGHI